MRIPTLLLILVATTVLAASQEPSRTTVAPSNAQKQAAGIIGTEQQFWEALKIKDGKFFDAHVSDDSSMIGYIGVLGKAAATDLFFKMPCKVISYTLTDFKVTFFTSKTALVTYKAATDGTCFGKPIPTVWASAVYVKRGKPWLKASHQETTAMTAAVALPQKPR